MFSISISQSFHADHAIRLTKTDVETPHSHDWNVSATVYSPTLNALGMVMDFAALQQALARIIDPLEACGDLNHFEPLAGLNPTAEVLARFIHGQLRGGLPESVGPLNITVQEASGCFAEFRD
jgi:6-pyruvoyl-tetrahydropterin synthase